MLDLKEVKKRKDLVLKELEGGLFGGDIRVVEVNGELLFNGRDCALILEYKAHQNAIKRHVLDDAKIKLKPKNFGCTETVQPKNFDCRETRQLENFNCPEMGQLKINNRGEVFITEQGLIDLITRSKMERAHDFRRWIGEVMTTFRKTGKYDMNDFNKSKYGKKSIKNLPGYVEDAQFKHECTVAVKNLSIEKGEVIGKIWNRINSIFFEHFGINIPREIRKFTKKNHLDKAPNTREFLDAGGYKIETYLAFEILKHDEKLRVNSEYLMTIIALCQHYYSMLNEYERIGIRNGLKDLIDKGVLKPSADYEAVESYTETSNGVQTLTFK